MQQGLLIVMCPLLNVMTHLPQSVHYISCTGPCADCQDCAVCEALSMTAAGMTGGQSRGPGTMTGGGQRRHLQHSSGRCHLALRNGDQGGARHICLCKDWGCKLHVVLSPCHAVA